MEATKVDGPTQAATGKATGTKGTWETAEERATKQIMIIRQNALTNAVNFVSDNATVEDVLETADRFASWVTDFEDELEDLDTPSVE